MGDHRASIKCEFEMHGHKAKSEWWINQDTTGCDDRIKDWFDEQVSIAMSRFNAESEKYWARENAAKIEADERATLDRLKAKYELKD